MAQSPPGPQPLQQHRAEHGVAILATLALFHAQGHALAVDVTDLPTFQQRCRSTKIELRLSI